MKKTLFLFIIAALVLLPLFAYLSAQEAGAQSSDKDALRDELQKKLDDLENQLKQLRSSEASASAKGESLKREIAIMKAEINKLEIQISLTSKKIDSAKTEIQGLEENIFDTQEKITKQQGAIGRLILFLNRLDGENLMTTLLKNKSISKFFRDEQYAANISTELLGMIEELRGTKDLLQGNKETLEDRKDNLEELNQETAAKRAALKGTQSTKDKLLVATKGQEAQYEKLIAELERKQQEFFTELQILENKIVAGGLYIVHVTATSVPPKGTKLFQWPQDGYRLTQKYGCTTYARCGKSRGAYGGAPHNGIDTAVGIGSPIKTIGEGTVIANGKNKGFGNWVAVKHGNGMVSLYAHNTSVVKAVGVQVKAGETIAYEGRTGHVTGPHLHLSLYRDFFTYEKSGELYFNYFEGSLNPLDYL